MCLRKLAYLLVKISINLLFLVGCSTPIVTPVAPVEIPLTNTPVPATEMPPTSTPQISNTSTETIIGNWQPLAKSRDAMFLQINSDGTCRQSYTQGRLIDIPEVECQYTFKGMILSMTVVKLNGVPECPSPTGDYEVRLVAGDQIQLVATKDSCAPRKRSTEGLYQRIP